MNNSLEAQAIREQFLETDPDYPIERWLNNFIKSEEEVRETADQLLALTRKPGGVWHLLRFCQLKFVIYMPLLLEFV